MACDGCNDPRLLGSRFPVQAQAEARLLVLYTQQYTLDRLGPPCPRVCLDFPSGGTCFSKRAWRIQERTQFGTRGERSIIRRSRVPRVGASNLCGQRDSGDANEHGWRAHLLFGPSIQLLIIQAYCLILPTMGSKVSDVIREYLLSRAEQMSQRLRGRASRFTVVRCPCRILIKKVDARKTSSIYTC